MVADILLHIFLPLLTQDTAVMASAFAYGLKIGVAPGWLIALNTLAVGVDIALFFLPAYLLSHRLHGVLRRRVGRQYDRGAALVLRLGPFRTATLMAFVMPSTAAMIAAGLLRLPLRHAAAGLFVGGAVYVAVPLVIALPIAHAVPVALLPLLRWTAPALVLLLVLLLGARELWRMMRRDDALDPTAQK